MPNPSNKIDQGRIERCARLYGSNRDAAIALGIRTNSFSRLCRKYGIEQPTDRRQREHRELVAERGRLSR